MFIITAEIYIFGALVYIILGRADRQRWAGGDHVRIKVAKKTAAGNKELANDDGADGERNEMKTFSSSAKKDCDASKLLADH